MTKEQIQALHNGDIVRHVQSGDAYVVIARHGAVVTAVRAINIANPSEWILAYHAEPVEKSAR